MCSTAVQSATRKWIMKREGWRLRQNISIRHKAYLKKKKSAKFTSVPSGNDIWQNVSESLVLFTPPSNISTARVFLKATEECTSHFLHFQIIQPASSHAGALSPARTGPSICCLSWWRIAALRLSPAPAPWPSACAAATPPVTVPQGGWRPSPCPWGSACKPC